VDDAPRGGRVLALRGSSDADFAVWAAELRRLVSAAAAAPPTPSFRAAGAAATATRRKRLVVHAVEARGVGKGGLESLSTRNARTVSRRCVVCCVVVVIVVALSLLSPRVVAVAVAVAAVVAVAVVAAPHPPTPQSPQLLRCRLFDDRTGGCDGPAGLQGLAEPPTARHAQKLGLAFVMDLSRAAWQGSTASVALELWSRPPTGAANGRHQTAAAVRPRRYAPRTLLRRCSYCRCCARPRVLPLYRYCSSSACSSA
jgi:hypothetical protein